MNRILRYHTIRGAIIGALLVVAAGRLGLLQVDTQTYVWSPIYGVAALACALWLAVTRRQKFRLGWSGRLGAVMSAAVLFGLAADVLPSASSAAMLCLWGTLALGEVFTWADG